MCSVTSYHPNSGVGECCQSIVAEIASQMDSRYMFLVILPRMILLVFGLIYAAVK
jgi:hypothetical protein